MIGEITNCDFTDHLRYALFSDHFRLAMVLYTIAQIQIDQCLILDANVSECKHHPRKSGISFSFGFQ